MRIALSGYYGFDNAGDEALLSAITSSIRRIEPQAEFVVFSGCPEKTSALHGIDAVYYLSPINIIKALRRSDLLISGGGSIFQDVTSARSLPYYISVVALAKLLGKPVIFYAQGVGPINRSFSRFLMRLVANRVDFITLRDEDSSKLLQEIGVTRPPFKITADPVFALQSSQDDQQQMNTLLENLGYASQPAIGVSVRKWAALEGYQPILARLLDTLSNRGYRIIFIPMAYPEDVEESRQVQSLMKNQAHLIDKNLASQEHLALIAGLDLMIGMRLHSLIFAAATGVPFAGISYDPKVDAFLKQFGLQPLPREYSPLEAEINRLLKDQSFKSKIEQKSEDLRAQSQENARLALALVKKPRRSLNS